MRWASAVSLESSLVTAVDECCAAVRAQLGTRAADLVFVFPTTHHRARLDRVAEILAARLPARVTVGCAAGGVIGGGREIEHECALVVTAAVLPGVELRPLRLDAADLPDPEEPREWVNRVGVPPDVAAHFVLLPDPFTCDTAALLRGIDRAYPLGRTIGGLASGGRDAGQHVLYLDGRAYRSGLVGLVLSGDLVVDTLVAQGCRPIGLPMFVTRSEDNLLLELDGRPAIDVLREVYEELPAADQKLARDSLFLGIVMSEQQQEYRQGDFLIRTLTGADASRGAVAVGALVRDNAVVQFHLRDAATSAADLETLLARYSAEERPTRPAGALLFSCLGRGVQLYGSPEHDSAVFRRLVGDMPLAGFFGNGEIGPVHGTTHLHGYTSAFAVFRPSR